MANPEANDWAGRAAGYERALLDLRHRIEALIVEAANESPWPSVLASDLRAALDG